jgi:membrane protease YdiL (CAAX protease family)
MDNLIVFSSTKDKSHRIIAWSLLAVLLFLRLPFFAGIASFSMPNWLWPTYDVGTYFFTACLIWWERERLDEFHIDRLALAIIILFKPIQTIILAIWKMNDNPLAFPHLPSLIVWIIAVSLFLALRFSHTRLPMFSRASFGWFGLGIVAGLLTVLLLGYPMSFQVDKTLISVTPGIFLILRTLPSFFYQLGYAAVTEEPLFRGFLWGYLQKAGWKNVWIWLFQAGLFSLGHIFYINKFPISFWLNVPIASLILGALVWRSKTISTSLATHAIVNTLGYTVGYIIASFR